MATHDGAATLPAVFAAYARLLPPVQPWQLLVIDNGSTDDTAAIVADHADRLPVRLLHHAQRGKNRALNAALDALFCTLPAPAAQDLLIFTDDDASPAPDWLQQWEAVARSQTGYAVFGAVITPAWAAPLPAWLRQIPQGLTYGLTSPTLAQGPVFPGLVWGANMAVRAAVFLAGHRFDASVGPAAGDYAMGSETEFVRRVALAGFRCWHAPGPRVAHQVRAEQLQLPYVLQKARRFGRGTYRQQRPGIYPELAGVPRWMGRAWLATGYGIVLAWLQRDRDRWLAARWELTYLHGYFLEAWRGRHHRPRTVLVTSYSGALGGMELRMAQEVRYLQGAGQHATLALRPFPGLQAWSQRLAAEQISVALFDPPDFLETWAGRRRQLWRARWLTTRRMQAFRADLVHVAFCWTQYGASALWLAAQCRLPAVLSVHNAFPAARFDRWQQRRLREAFASVRGVYAVSASAMTHFLAIYQAYLPAGAKLAVIPNPVDTAQFQPCSAARLAARQRWGLPADALVLGSVARLALQKRPQALLALFAMLTTRFAGLYLVLAGEGPLEAALRAQAADLGVADRVVFTGFVADVATLMPAFDVHLLLSRNEGFGIATAEAMACGLPVVATDVPGNADLLRGSAAGLLVAPDDAASALDCVAALLADPGRRAAMGRHGRAEAQARYSIDVVGQQLQDFYDGLL